MEMSKPKSFKGIPSTLSNVNHSIHQPSQVIQHRNDQCYQAGEVVNRGKKPKSLRKLRPEVHLNFQMGTLGGYVFTICYEAPGDKLFLHCAYLRKLQKATSKIHKGGEISKQQLLKGSDPSTVATTM